MNKVLIAVDDTKSSIAAVNDFCNIFPANPPEVVLLYVEKIGGWSFMSEFMGDPELSTVKNSLQGTEYQEMLDKKAKTILEYHEKNLKEKGVTNIKRIAGEGIPSDEILNTAKDEGVDLIVIGSRGKRLSTMFLGSVSREVANRAEIPVLIAR